MKKTKNKNFSIPANFMEMDEFSKISSVLYCGHPASHSWNNGHVVGGDFLFAYHANLDDPIADDLFKFGRGIRKNVEKNIIIDTNQKND